MYKNKIGCKLDGNPSIIFHYFITITFPGLLLKCICLLRIVTSARLRADMTNSVMQGNGEQNRSEVKQAVILIWISIIFVVCQSPKIIPDFYEALHCKHVEVSIRHIFKRIVTFPTLCSLSSCIDVLFQMCSILLSGTVFCMRVH